MPATVVSVRKVADADSATDSSSEGTAVVVYRVEYTDADYHPAAALSASGPGPGGGTVTVAGIGSTLAGTGMSVVNRSAQRLADHPHVCDVTCNYSVRGFSTSAPANTKWNTDVSAEGIEYQEPVYKDRNGKAITNSAFDPFDPALEKSYYDERVTVTYQTNTLNANTFADYRGKVNLTEVTMTVRGVARTFAPWTLKVGGGSSWSIGYTDGVFTAFNVKLELLYRKDTWRRKTIDQGYAAFVEDVLGVFRYVRLRDERGEELQKPALLDGTGVQITRPAPGASLITGVVFPPDGWEIDDPVNLNPLFVGL